MQNDETKNKIIKLINKYLTKSEGEDSPSTEYIATCLSLNVSMKETKKLLAELVAENKIKRQMIIPEGCHTKEVECWRTIADKPPEPKEENIDYTDNETEEGDE